MIKCRGYRGHPLSKADLVRNKEIAVIRSGGERPFATYKSHYGLARTRLMGLAKNLTLFGLAAITHNIAKGGNVPGALRPARPGTHWISVTKIKR